MCNPGDGAVKKITQQGEVSVYSHGNEQRAMITPIRLLMQMAISIWPILVNGKRIMAASGRLHQMARHR